MPQVSICIPTRNRAHFLRSALEHLAKFSRLDFEVVISDNHSSDDTADVVESFRDRIPALYYVRQNEPLNFYETQLPPFNVAAGDYLVYLSDDDRLVEDGVVETIDRFEADPSIAAIYCAWQEVMDGVRGSRHQHFDEPVRYTLSDLPKVLRDLKAAEMPFMRRSAYERSVSPIQYQYGFDLYTLSQLLKAGDILLTPTLTHMVTRHEGQESTKLYRDELLQCYLADYELLTSNAPSLDPLVAMVSIAEKMSLQYIVAAQRALDDLRFFQARTLFERAKVYGNAAAREWVEKLDNEMWPLVVADVAIGFARTAGKVSRIAAELTAETELVVEAMSKLATPIEVVSGTADELMFLSWQEDEFFFYADVETLRMREALAGQPLRKARSLAQLRAVTRLGPGEAENTAWQEAS